MDIPLRSISIADFRRLEGHQVFPLDAPIVLLHGPNGAGKTSILSALELALTGEIRSMRRQDIRYTAHLPFHGQEFATVRASVSDGLATNLEPTTMTVGGNRIEGAAALDREAAQFYAERCYLDQVSLGQLLELYQYREGKEESALARFVNELLGLEQLDALRSGLSDATDLRRLKKLSQPLAEADAAAQRASTELAEVTKELESARDVSVRCRSRLTEALAVLGLTAPDASDEEELAGRVEEVLASVERKEDLSVDGLNQSLTALGGKIGVLANRPSVRRLEEARVALAAAEAARSRWRSQHGVAVEGWMADAANLDLDLDLSGEDLEPLDDELRQIARTLTSQATLADTASRLEQQLADSRTRLHDVQDSLSGAQELAGSLVEGLSALRGHAEDGLCPVCDRDFAEVSSMSLTAHIDGKLAELTNQGTQLRELRLQRDAVATQVQRDEQDLDQIRGQLWSEVDRETVSARAVALEALRDRLLELQLAIVDGRNLVRQVREAASELAEAEAIVAEAEVARSELEQVARSLGVPPLDTSETLEDGWRRVSNAAAGQLEQRAAHKEAFARAAQLLEDFLESSSRVAGLKERVTEAAERKLALDRRVQEARRRQSVAKAVHDASSKARAEIVQRVFTESLNDVWRSVFTRLAPREPFVPAFGIPSSSRTALELTLETVHRSGSPGGPPQMMLSAGNLNTAALSLFIALHLAVEPLVPCLVFDDPVQSMDEVHIAQFAGLIRVLSKHHRRQVVIAVHEQELFRYLALELSPAFEGDELITIELGARSQDEDQGITRLAWSPDAAIAG